MIRRFAVAVFALALGALAITSVPQFTSDVSAQPTVGSAPVQVLPDFADLADRVGPAVVGVRTTARAGAGQSALPFPDIDENDPMFEFFRRFFPNPRSSRSPPGSADSRRRGAKFRAASGRDSSSRLTAM